MPAGEPFRRGSQYGLLMTCLSVNILMTAAPMSSSEM